MLFSLARSAVGYSYYWGHGSWGTDGRDHGSCSGSCPSCSHTGRYGADCSGFVAKVWQIPSASPVTTNRHPYSTYKFVNSTTHWSRVARTAVRPGDASHLQHQRRGAHRALRVGLRPLGRRVDLQGPRLLHGHRAQPPHGGE